MSCSILPKHFERSLPTLHPSICNPGPEHLFSRKDFPLVTSITDLYGKRIAVPKGFHRAELLKEYPEVEVVEVRDIVESMRAVSVGQADALYDIMPVF